MQTEQNTFNRLKRPPVSEMLELMGKLKRPIQVYSIGTSAIQQPDYYREISFHYDRIKLLEENGWDFEEFMMELEKNNILSMIKEYNNSLQFPSDLIERAKRFYPNAKFIEASIVLE